ncbi:TldD/PmbA family protein [Petrimonas sulfuriphila]|jgi:PmbA protein|uniref:TldD/PmbA family protein n=1 Tax=Petrimonas TaxID=307628 RepID=UPI000F0CCBDB|nr:TldD/PmbA family protein [Petrimonas sp.]NLU28684.1 TldD/PmbA family protein [Bacteroidales bacterium]BBD46510.1 peptidase U62, modulator of DNA gyrase [Petrimonas sp. IBARAKI]
MISNENKKLAQWAMDYALKNGCQAAKVSLYSGSNTSFELRDAQMDKLQQASESRMSLFLYVDGRYGTYSTNRLDKKELESFIRNGVESTRYLAEDEARVLPDASRYYKGGKPDLQLLDPQFSAVNPDNKVALAQAIAEEALGKDPRIISVESSYGDGDGFSYQITSNGFEGETQQSWYSLSASVAVKGEGEARPSSYWYESSLYLDKLVKEGVGQKALERTLQKIGQKKTKSGRYTMVVDPMNSGQLLRPMLSAIFGSALQQKNSFLLDKLGQKVGSDKFTLLDEPHLIGASGARYFDSEGVATERRSVFDKGVLKTYYIDTYNAKKMDVDPTVANPSILVMQLGNKDLNGLISDVAHGILVTGFNGGNSNSSTGDFSYGIEGFLIEKGKLTLPLSEMNVTGNMITLWNSLAETGNDPRLNSSWRIPSLVFEGVDFSGL